MNWVKRSATFLIFIAGCDRPATPPAPNDITHSAQIEITADVIEVAKDANQFATDLYSRLGAESKTNLCFSPYSISTALAMTYAGAHGETKSQMAAVLHFPKEESELHPAMNSLRRILSSNNKTSGVELRVANRLWRQQDFYLLREFLKVTTVHYGAGLGEVDFRQSEQARQTINSWVGQQTDHKIPNFIGPGIIDSRTRLVLTNAVYFKGSWEIPFAKSLTKKTQFHVSKTEIVDVPMMTMRYQHQLRYAEVDKVQVLELPYGQEKTVSMLVLLPRAVDGLNELEAQLASDGIAKWIDDLKSTKLEVYLPRFKVTSEFGLKDVLSSMGMPLAFSSNADFSRMSRENQLFIDAVVHKAFVNVNEEGTEAGAATAVVMAVSAGIPFVADHPFVFLIRDNRTQSILFLGRVINPMDSVRE